MIRKREAGEPIQRLAMLGNHLPRHCGIATFTTDLLSEVRMARPGLDAFVVAMNDVGKTYAYPEAVRFEIEQADPASYQRAADFLNVTAADVVSVQHEYGIFGGKAGAHLLSLLADVRAPIVTTLHTILAEPSADQRAVMSRLTELSERIIVMSENGGRLLSQVHGVSPDKIDFIPHGIPTVPRDDTSRRSLGVMDRQVILTFGLLSPDKGVEYVIDALPAILERVPNALYMVVGETHPHVKAHHGETYRLMLQSRAEKLGVLSNVVFHDRFVTMPELLEFLSAADIYVTPYLKAEQITSGTLAYAVGAGKAIISTPYTYAKELLADGRGMLVPSRDSAAIAAEAISIFLEPAKRASLQQRAAEFGAKMSWRVVANQTLASFERAKVDYEQRSRDAKRALSQSQRRVELPQVKLDHLRAMTDDTGLLQHATFNVPRYRDGYCTDDNARALLFTALMEDAEGAASIAGDMGMRYLAFIDDAFSQETGRFRNFMSHSRQWLEAVGSEDSHGRALWSLGTVVGRSVTPGRQSLAGQLFHSALPAIDSFTSPRAWAYSLLGIDEYLRAFRGDSQVQALQERLALRLVDIHDRASSEAWPWFEESLTYGNARLSQAMLVSGGWLANERMTSIGLRSLEWLVSVQRGRGGCFAPIGSNGFHVRGGERARFDQQPVEACAMVSACLEAHRRTSDASWLALARKQFTWFLGHNDLELPLYDASTGGCRDGLHQDRVNQNQGAESTLSFLMALVEMHSCAAAVARLAPPPDSTAPSEATKRSWKELSS